MLLVYCRLYVTYALAGYLYNLDQSNICRDVHYLEPLVKRCIPLPKKIHDLTRRLRTLERGRAVLPRASGIH
ncbi:MAG: transposase family protein [Thaumarchaeota archaeon]|nr:transposase family protein [Nitrososphaerota archaeon]